VLGAVFLMACRGAAPFQATSALGVTYPHVQDDMANLGIAWELLRGVPPREFPFAAGLPFPPYHVFSYLAGRLLASRGIVDVLTGHHAVQPMLHLALLVFGIGLATLRATGSRSLATATLVTVFFVDDPLARWLGLTQTSIYRLLLSSESQAGGLVVWAALVALLAIHERVRDVSPAGSGARRWLALAALLGGLAYGFKAQTFLVLMPGLLIALAVTAYRRRSIGYLAAGAGAVLPALVLIASWRAPTRMGSLMLVGPEAATAGHAILWLARRMHAFWEAAGCPVLAVVFVADRLRRIRSVQLLDGFLLASVAVAGLMFCFLRVSEVGYGQWSDLALREGVVPLRVAASAIGVVVLARLLARLGWNGPRAALVVALLAAAAFLPEQLARPPVERAQTLLLCPGEAEALAFLRDSTPLDAVVAHVRSDSVESAPDRFLNQFPVVAALGGRRVVLEYFGRRVDPSQNRAVDLRLLFRTRDAAEARAILLRYGVRYVLEYSRHRMRCQLPELASAYAAGDVRVLEFRPAPGAAPP